MKTLLIVIIVAVSAAAQTGTLNSQTVRSPGAGAKAMNAETLLNLVLHNCGYDTTPHADAAAVAAGRSLEIDCPSEPLTTMTIQSPLEWRGGGILQAAAPPAPLTVTGATFSAPSGANSFITYTVASTTTMKVGMEASVTGTTTTVAGEWPGFNRSGQVLALTSTTFTIPSQGGAAGTFSGSGSVALQHVVTINSCPPSWYRQQAFDLSLGGTFRVSGNCPIKPAWTGTPTDQVSDTWSGINSAIDMLPDNPVGRMAISGRPDKQGKILLDAIKYQLSQTLFAPAGVAIGCNGPSPQYTPIGTTGLTPGCALVRMLTTATTGPESFVLATDYDEGGGDTSYAVRYEGFSVDCQAGFHEPGYTAPGNNTKCSGIQFAGAQQSGIDQVGVGNVGQRAVVALKPTYPPTTGLWLPDTSYSVGQRVVDTNPDNPSPHTQRVTTAGISASANSAALTITAANNAGGALQIVVSSTAAMASGQTWYIRGVSGTGFSDGLWGVNVINGTTFAIGSFAASGSYTVSSAYTQRFNTHPNWNHSGSTTADGGVTWTDEGATNFLANSGLHNWGTVDTISVQRGPAISIEGAVALHFGSITTVGTDPTTGPWPGLLSAGQVPAGSIIIDPAGYEQVNLGSAFTPGGTMPVFDDSSCGDHASKSTTSDSGGTWTCMEKVTDDEGDPYASTTWLNTIQNSMSGHLDCENFYIPCTKIRGSLRTSFGGGITMIPTGDVPSAPAGAIINDGSQDTTISGWQQFGTSFYVDAVQDRQQFQTIHQSGCWPRGVTSGACTPFLAGAYSQGTNDYTYQAEGTVLNQSGNSLAVGVPFVPGQFPCQPLAGALSGFVQLGVPVFFPTCASMLTLNTSALVGERGPFGGNGGGATVIDTVMPSALAIASATAGTNILTVVVPSTATMTTGDAWYVSGLTGTNFVSAAYTVTVASGTSFTIPLTGATGTYTVAASAFAQNSAIPDQVRLRTGFSDAVIQGGVDDPNARSATLRSGATGASVEVTPGAGIIVNGLITDASYAAGVAHFIAGGGLTSSLVNLAIDVTGLLPHAHIASTAVTPGSYTNASITVAADGSVTGAASGAAGGVSSIVAGAGISVSGPTGAVTVTNSAPSTATGGTFTCGAGLHIASLTISVAGVPSGTCN